jgi:NAD(P)-dependent dehydrogenase (short-subunit alcohol dehydrogenase family)
MKTAIVTGAYGAIGKAIARNLAEKGISVILVGRDEAKLAATTEDIIRKTGSKEVRFRAVDLSRKKQIEALAAEWEGPLDILINNACTAPRQRTETPEGIEMQFAANVLGYHWMIRSFSPFIKGREDARIVNVASYWAGGLDLSDPEFRKRRYDNDAAYRQSKQADRMLAVAWAERLLPSGITVNSCHPGDVNSKLSNSLGFGGHETPDQGAATPVYVATSPQIKNVTGKYFADRREELCQFSGDRKGIENLFDICDEY